MDLEPNSCYFGRLKEEDWTRKECFFGDEDDGISLLIDYPLP